MYISRDKVITLLRCTCLICSADSPVLWIRLDTEMTLLRCIVIEQPDYQWQYQLRHERDITAQLEAIVALEHFPTPATRLALTDTIENEHMYVQVRCRAAHCLTKVANNLCPISSCWTLCPHIMEFKKLI